MAGFLQDIIDFYNEQLERRRNLPFLKATMASCAMVATVDGDVTFAERIRMDQILEALERIRVFDPHEGVDLFNEYARTILDTPEKGRLAALHDIEAAIDGKETAELLIRVCLGISESGGSIAMPEQIEIVSLCSRLGVDPQSVGLYQDPQLKS